jgi:hypothetical protein
LLLGGCWLVGLVFAVGWLGYSGLGDIAPNARDAEHLALSQELSRIVTERVPFYARQFVGLFGYGEVSPPRFALPAWYLLVAALVVPGMVWARRRFVVVPVLLALFSLGLLGAMELYFLPKIGWFSQGRYAMAALVGVVLLPASAGGFEAWLAARGWLRGYLTAGAAVAGVLQLYVLARVMTRFQTGPDASLNPLTGTWHPLAGPLPPLLAALAGAGLLVAVMNRVGSDAAAVPDPGEANGDERVAETAKPAMTSR